MKTRDFITNLLHISKTAEPIENKSDYTRVSKWVKRATKLYTVFSIVIIIIALLFLSISSALFDEISNEMFAEELPNMEIFSEIMAVPAQIVILLVSVLTAWGFATMILNFRLMIKSLWSSSVKGYHAGEQIKINHVSVRHDYGNTYSVRNTTEDKGCLFACIYGFINLFVWAFLCVYVCPFLTFRKIKDSKKNLEIYKQSQMQMRF